MNGNKESFLCGLRREKEREKETQCEQIRIYSSMDSLRIMMNRFSRTLLMDEASMESTVTIRYITQSSGTLRRHPVDIQVVALFT